MRRFPLFLLTLACVLSLHTTFARADLSVPPADPHITYVGRFTSDYRFGWTGSAIRIRFDGSSAAALLSPNKTAAMQIIIDGKPADKIILTKDQSRYQLAADLSPGPHTVELFQRTEGSFGETRFNGFELSDGAKLLALPRADRRILAFGDSITCAYASEEPDRNKGNTVQNENGYLSYAAIAARHFNADISMVCWSGRGIFRNRNTSGDDRKNVIPDYLDKTLPYSKDTFDLTTFVPHLIIINLGTNDLNTGKNEKPALDKTDYLAAYRRFIDQLHKLYPDAPIIAAIGPMAGKPISEWLPELDAEYPFVHTLVFRGYNGHDDEIGGHWHPSVKGHQRMADELSAKIREIMKW